MEQVRFSFLLLPGTGLGFGSRPAWVCHPKTERTFAVSVPPSMQQQQHHLVTWEGRRYNNHPAFSGLRMADQMFLPSSQTVASRLQRTAVMVLPYTDTDMASQAQAAMFVSTHHCLPSLSGHQNVLLTGSVQSTCLLPPPIFCPGKEYPPGLPGSVSPSTAFKKKAAGLGTWVSLHNKVEHTGWVNNCNGPMSLSGTQEHPPP